MDPKAELPYSASPASAAAAATRAEVGGLAQVAQVAPVARVPLSDRKSGSWPGVGVQEEKLELARPLAGPPAGDPWAAAGAGGRRNSWNEHPGGWQEAGPGTSGQCRCSGSWRTRRCRWGRGPSWRPWPWGSLEAGGLALALSVVDAAESLVRGLGGEGGVGAAVPEHETEHRTAELLDTAPP